MARIRTIKPEIFKNDDLAALPPLARLVFIGLFGQADRRGRMLDRPKRLRADILPYDDDDFDNLLQLLHDAKFIIRYVVDEVRFIQISNFEKHQRITGKEALIESEFPQPPEWSQRKTTGASKGKQRGNNRASMGSAGKEGKGKEGNKEQVQLDSISFPKELENQECKQALSEWLEHRKQKHEPATPLAIEKTLKQWAPAGAAAFIAAIEHSIANGWKGVFAPKPTPNGTGPPAKTDAERERIAAKQARELAIARGEIPS